MTDTQQQITSLEEQLRQAELGPDPNFFQEALAENVVLLDQEGRSAPKSKVVDSHRPGAGPKFTRVEMSDLQIVDQGSVAIVTCRGTYESAQGSFQLGFMRVWLKKDNRWQIIAATVFK